MNGVHRLTALALSVAILAAAPTLAADKNRPEHLFGPAPTWDEYRKVAEAGLRDRLIDPESARITWTGGFFKGEFKPLLSARIEGYVACGTVNSRNRMGGYAGATNFVTVVDYGRVLFVDVDRVAGGMIAAACNKSAQAGLLPSLPADNGAGLPPSPPAAATPAYTDAPALTSGGASGLTLRAMPDGAYVSAVAAASPAGRAGLKPGMVITSVNAIPLAGMDDAMVKVVDAAGPTALLTLVGGKTVKLGGQP